MKHITTYCQLFTCYQLHYMHVVTLSHKYLKHTNKKKKKKLKGTYWEGNVVMEVWQMMI